MKSGEIKFIFILILGVVILLGSVSFMSANCAVTSLGPKTVITGVVLDENNNPIDGATVTISCNHNGFKNTKSGKSGLDGEYYTTYVSSPQQSCNGQCYKGDIVTVKAKKSGITGLATGVVNDKEASIDVMLQSSVPVVPEFGVTAGIVTVLGAVGTFFVIRKKHHVRIKRKL